jgi:hypothetical protein
MYCTKSKGSIEEERQCRGEMHYRGKKAVQKKNGCAEVERLDRGRKAMPRKTVRMDTGSQLRPRQEEQTYKYSADIE